MRDRMTKLLFGFVRHATRNTQHAFIFLFCGLLAHAAEVDPTKLPPPAAKTIDFTTDIKPILEASCLKCHGAEKPKSRFRLDNRESALKGGENGVDILPGQSAKSPLIHFVARLVEDTEMPPLGKGEPLTPEQIGLLRAWIDQGVGWEAVEPAGALAFSVSPTIRFITVSGNEQKFREHYWQRDGWNGGVEHFEVKEQRDASTRTTLEGHAILDDYKVALTLERDDFGFIRAGAEQFRKYYDNSGGYYPLFTTPAYSLDRDLHLDIGRVWVDFGLTLPDWPRMVLGYEYQHKDGEQSTLQWGPVTEGADTRNIQPAAKTIKEHVHVIKFDLDHEIHGVLFEDSFRGEFYDLTTRRTVGQNYVPGNPAATSQFDVREGQQHFEGANVVRLEKKFTGWLFASGGYLYSKLNGDASYEADFIQNPPSSPLTMFRSQGIVLERENHVGNANLLLGPWKGLTFSSGVQAEWTKQTGVGDSRFDAVFLPRPIFVNFRSDRDTAAVEEQLGLRFTGVPATVFFAEARLRQESRGTFEEQVGGDHDFKHDTDASSDVHDARVGFRTSPCRFADLSAHYRHFVKDNSYNHLTDQSDEGGVNYPAFILSQETSTDEVEARLVLRPLNWLKTTFTCKLLATDFHTATDPVPARRPGGPIISPGGAVFAGNYDAHVYSANATLTPWRRLYLSSSFSFEQSRTVTFANGGASIVPYRGDTYSVVASGTFVCDAKTDLFASYAFSRADYSQNNYADGLPVGIAYDQHAVLVGVKRRLTKNLATRFQYGFYTYDEPPSGGLNNYTAHAIFGSLNFKLP